ncbi:MAG: helix-turn-helix transcriptional regulator [Gemmatimonadetes bacterium]|nr:helix-turn-helix transcriptional regulator [Gemmatimonadota bacterium]
MSWTRNAATLVREARARAGLTQRELARRSGTAQSVVARIEGEQTSPGADTLARLLAAAGWDLHAELWPQPPADTHMLDDVPRILALSPEDRLREVAALDRFVAGARRA